MNHVPVWDSFHMIGRRLSEETFPPNALNSRISAMVCKSYCDLELMKRFFGIMIFTVLIMQWFWGAYSVMLNNSFIYTYLFHIITALSYLFTHP